MGVEPSPLNGDCVHDFLVGMAFATALAAVSVVGFEAAGAAAGDPVDANLVALALLCAGSGIGGLAAYRRES